MKDRVIGLLGAGNLRSSPLTMASLAAWKPDDLVEIRLWDSNEERLDLFDRFLRACLDHAGTQHVVSSSTDLEETLSPCKELIISLHEDCARRLVGKSEAHFIDVEEANDSWSAMHGDPNKPTPPEHLSEHMKSILSSPVISPTQRADVMDSAFQKILDTISQPSPRLLNITRGHALPLGYSGTNIEWPPAVPSGDYSAVPHQVLRWIHGDETLQKLIIEALESPVSQWLEAV